MKNGQKGIATRGERRPGLLGLPEDMDRFFERAFGTGPWLPWAPTRRWRRAWLPEEWMPEIDVFEREGNLIIRADLPGMKREDLEVKIHGDTLVLHGHREEKEEVEEKDYHHSERRSGTFTRTVALPEGFNADAIEATYTDGVLEVVVPKPAAVETKPVQIPVK